MKALIISLFFMFFSTGSWASCHQFELDGIVKIEGPQMLFIVAEKTLSEVRFKISEDHQDRFAPYINKWAKVKMITHSGQINYNTKINSIVHIEPVAPNLLNQGTKSVFKKLGETKCLKK